MHWCSWKNLCKPKSEGGLRFRDLGAFNKVMLAKQCWRLIRFPESLAARVIKDCYFRSSSFLSAKSGYGSFLWKGENETVDALKLSSGGWNSNLIKGIFCAEEAGGILSIPPCSRGSKDRLLWHYHISGNYSVRSGYWLASSLSEKADQGSFMDFVILVSKQVGLQELESLCVVWWNIWYRRKSMLHGKALIPMAEVLE
ncbi:hypothetical protein Q3G72_009871 [Acer saccharum]|nr:hypothetical protein Q3G72_009871 [Acer saccharum]